MGLRLHITVRLLKKKNGPNICIFKVIRQLYILTIIAVKFVRTHFLYHIVSVKI